MTKPFSVAIDGPSGAGKSTISKLLAKELGFIYVDTGALYRAIGYEVLNRGGKPNDSDFVEGILPEINLELKYIEDMQCVLINGEDVTGLIRTPEVSMAASSVSAIPAVRRFLFDLQRETAQKSDVIMDGRDIGTVVLPGADIKIFLTASVQDRAGRRYEELKLKGISTTYSDVLDDMTKRDYNDSNRAAAPLKAAENSIMVDTTGNTLEQSVEIIKGIIQKARKNLY
ncbi:MAG: (d)CMP kinase [Oscillospiraceae bacterium]|nr:(d)CMP kinase [Oscillospiraceae bacterium]MDD3833121.1 (d)CMP kinase [Oscillospiraceae bacterium]